MDRQEPSSAIRVLIADDHPTVRVGIAAILRTALDIEVVAEAATAAEAIQAFIRHTPDVALVDLRMPGGGQQAIQAICAHRSDARVIVLTMHAGDDDIVQSLRAGARGYLLKGAPADEIIQAVRAVCAGQRYVTPRVGARLSEHVIDRGLTPREMDVLRLMAQGRDNRAIARELKVGLGTVKSHVVTILSKLEAEDRTNAVIIALRKGLVQME